MVTRMESLTQGWMKLERSSFKRQRQLRFLVDGNGARAAIAAGYAKANAKQIASQVLNNPAIAAEVERRTEARIQKLDIKADNVLQELGCLAFANMADYITVQDDGSVTSINGALS